MGESRNLVQDYAQVYSRDLQLSFPISIQTTNLVPEELHPTNNSAASRRHSLWNLSRPNSHSHVVDAVCFPPRGWLPWNENDRTSDPRFVDPWLQRIPPAYVVSMDKNVTCAWCYCIALTPKLHLQFSYRLLSVYINTFVVLLYLSASYRWSRRARLHFISLPLYVFGFLISFIHSTMYILFSKSAVYNWTSSSRIHYHNPRVRLFRLP